jgi:MFS family permease
MSQSRVTVLFLNIGHLYDHFFMLILPTVVLTLEVEWHRPYGELLALGTAGFIAFGVGTLPSGWLGDRWSRSAMMTLFFVGIGVSAIVTGLARGPFELAVCLTLVGIFASIYHPVGMAMVVEQATAMGRELGINGVFGNLGVAFAAVTTAALTEQFGWRAAFLAPGAVSVLTGLAFALHMRRGGKRAHAGARAKRLTVALPRAAMVRVIGVVLVGALCGGLVFNAATVVLPKLYEEQLAGLATTASGIGGFATVTFAVAAIAQIFVGYLLDRYPLKPLYILIPLVQAPLLLLIVHAQGWPLVATALVLFLFNFGGIPISDWMVGRYATDAWRARVYSVKQAMGFGVSALTLPIVGLLHDRAGGFSTLLPLLAVLALVVSSAGLFLPNERRAVTPAAAAASGD